MLDGVGCFRVCNFFQKIFGSVYRFVIEIIFRKLYFFCNLCFMDLVKGGYDKFGDNSKVWCTLCVQ